MDKAAFLKEDRMKTMKACRKYIMMLLVVGLIFIFSTGILAENYSGLSEAEQAMTEAMAIEEATVVLPFADVPQDAWYNVYVLDLFSNGIITGTTKTTFYPEKKITRAEFAKMLAIPSGVDEMNYQAKNSNSFNNVLNSDWYTRYVLWASESGIVVGKTPDSFRPNDYITREEAETMIYRMAKNTTNHDLMVNTEKMSFKDEDQISNWAKDAVEMLQISGVIKGSEGYFKPQGIMNRAEAAAILSTYLLMDYQTCEVEYFNEHIKELEDEIKANEEYINSLPDPEESSFILPDSSLSNGISLF